DGTLLSGIPGCRFSIEATLEDEVASGSFRCRMSDEAVDLGIPFTTLDGAVGELSEVSARHATASGTAVLTLPDETLMEEVAFVALLREGRVGVGGLRIFLLDVFDGEPGDSKDGDGHYGLHEQTVSEGYVRVEPPPEPEPEPDPDPSPGPTPDPTPEPGGGHSNEGGGGGSGSSGTGPLDSGEVPPFVLGGSNSTARLMAILAQTSPTGIPDPRDVLSVVGPFPVAGLAWWQDDWHAYRCCPHEHLHQGMDMFAERGTPLVATADGVVSQKVNGSVSGLGVEVTDATGTQYFYAHLDAFAAGLRQGQRVRRGDVLGYVGNTGNARGTSAHVHFEVQPGGVPVPPKPYVDLWLTLAEVRAEALVEAQIGTQIQEDEGLLAWLNRAEELAGDSSTELSGEEEGLAIRAASAVGGSSGVSSGAMILFSAGMFLLLLVGPGIASGRRQAERQAIRSRAPRSEA
ncbi:MAG TPA: M23 family metallopeptidase, partial [Actinomycetota bacterium]|nr:M23 family metallopeptidase [Actinomycetota bacterium]